MNKSTKRPVKPAVTKAPKITERSKAMHPRNVHNSGYDFPALVSCYSELAPFVSTNAYGNLSIDFALPQAVKALNAALLKYHYSIDFWDIPTGFLCPPIPGRVDYIHHIADLLAVKKAAKSRIPRGEKIRALDIGMGANAIYPLLGAQAYGWRFVGTDVDPVSLNNAQKIFNKNKALNKKLSCRLQPNAAHVFQGIMETTDRFDVTLCNPPFHASLAEASAGTARKVANLTANKMAKSAPENTQKPSAGVLNFGGQKAELWCEGGEQQFLRNMMTESKMFSTQCLWFTTLVSKKDNLPFALAQLQQLKAADVKVIDMHQGNKITRILAWTFLTSAQHHLWQQYREI